MDPQEVVPVPEAVAVEMAVLEVEKALEKEILILKVKVMVWPLLVVEEESGGAKARRHGSSNGYVGSRC